MLKSCTASPSNLSPSSYVSCKTSRPVSQFQSVQSQPKRQQSQNQLITCLMEQLKETRMRELNLKRINNTLVKALEGQKKAANSNDCQDVPLNIMPLEEVTEQRLQQEQQLNNYLKKKVDDLEKSSKTLSRNNSQNSISSQCSSKSRRQSVQRMQNLIDGMVKSKCNVNENWASSTVIVDKMTKKTQQDPTANINALIMDLASQKIEMQLRIRSIENQLCNRDLTRKQRELLENSLKNLRKTSKSDQYQEYLKDKIIKEIDRFSTRVVMRAQKRI